MIFLDVGSHNGQTLEEVVKPKYDFEKIFSFEPMPKQYAHLVEVYGNDPRIVLCNYGLSDQNGTFPLYGNNDIMEATIYPTKNDADESIVTECSLVIASVVVKTIVEHELGPLIVKLNCEGAEIPILNNLVDSGAIHEIQNVMIDFDIRKVVGMEDEERKILQRFREIGFTRFSLCDDVMVGATHQDRIANWLSGVL